MQQQLTIVLVVAVCASSFFSVALTASVSKRAASDASPTAKDLASKSCYSSTPCGWMVYVPFTRRNDYFMKNTCECAEGKTCKQAEDDLSVSAYIYRCLDDGPSAGSATRS